jgi:hypothetical protein
MHLVGRKVCSIFENSFLHARLLVLMHVQDTIPLYTQVKVGLINLCKGLFSLNARTYYKLKSDT